MNLENITLVAVSSIKISETVAALDKSRRNLNFAEVLLISHERPIDLPVDIRFRKCRRLNSIDAYNWFMVFELAKYIETDFALVVQHDGYVLRPDLWRDDFLNYDYIGAPWPKNSFFDGRGREVRVGNGGFSLRSNKLLNAFNNLQIVFDSDVTSFPSEDAVICVYHGRKLADYGIKFAPVEIAACFSRELDCHDSVKETFGFHYHPEITVPGHVILKNNFKVRIKKIIKKIIPRPIINQCKKLFLEDVRRGINGNDK